jgi:hypothetical protein
MWHPRNRRKGAEQPMLADRPRSGAGSDRNAAKMEWLIAASEGDLVFLGPVRAPGLMTAQLNVQADVQSVNLPCALTHSFGMSTAQDFALMSGLPLRLIWMALISSSPAIGSPGGFIENDALV